MKLRAPRTFRGLLWCLYVGAFIALAVASVPIPILRLPSFIVAVGVGVVLLAVDHLARIVRRRTA